MAYGRKTGGKKPGSGTSDPARARDTALARKMAKKHGRKAITILHDIMSSPTAPAAARVTAATALLDRAFGRTTPAPGDGETATTINVNISKDDEKL